MNVCPYCDHNNPDDRVICAHCGRRFSLRDAGIPTLLKHTTSMVFPSPEELPTERTARFPKNANAVLYVQGSQVPLVVNVQALAVLGRTSADHSLNPHLDLGAFQAHTRGVSARHAALQRNEEQLLLRDLGSTNGTYVNGERLVPYQAVVICNGDEIHLGQLVMQIFFQRQVQHTA